MHVMQKHISEIYMFICQSKIDNPLHRDSIAEKSGTSQNIQWDLQISKVGSLDFLDLKVNGSPGRPLGLQSSTLPLSHCAPNHQFFKLLRKPMLVFEFLSKMLFLMHSLFFEDNMIIQDYLAHSPLTVTRINYFILMLFFCIPELDVWIIFVNFQLKNGRNNEIVTKKKHTYQQLNLLNDRCT